MLDLAHLGVIVKNGQKSSDFYCQVLGCTREGSWQNQEIIAIELHCGNLIIELLEYLSPQEQVRTNGVYDHLAFRTENITASIRQLNELGIGFETATPKKLTTGKKIIFFRGPDGERIELIEEP